MKTASATVPYDPSIGIRIEYLRLGSQETRMATQLSPDALEKYCRRHGIRIYTIPGKCADGTADHRRVRRFILYSEFISGSVRAAEKGER